jgi:hypothetical protein
MKPQTTPFARENQNDPQHLLISLSAQERSLVMAMAKRLEISFLQAARQFTQEKNAARRR